MPLALLSLFLASFCMGTTEFMIAGLLPAISSDLDVSIPVAGLLVTGYAVGVAVGGPIIALLLAGLRRKRAILVTMAIFLVGHVFCALAPSYELLLTGRIIISLSHGTFYGMAVLAAVGVVPAEKSGRAVALIFAAITIASIAGVPVGTAIGNLWGWRAAFWTLCGVATLFTLALAAFLPGDSGDRKSSPGIGAQLRALGDQKVYLAFGIIIAITIAFWSFYTFVSPFLTAVSGVPETWVPTLLLLFGIGATAGAVLGGRFADLMPQRTLLLTFPIQALIYAGIIVVAGSGTAMGVGLFALGALYFMPNAALTNRILQGASKAPELASTLLSSVFNSGIAAGAFLGARALEQGLPYIDLPWIGVGFSLLAIAGCLLTLRLDGRQSATHAPARVS